MSLTIVTITHNDEPRLADFMARIVCDQWVVVDQHSTDRTADLIRSYPGKVDLVLSEFTEHRDGSRTEAMDLVTSEWVLWLSPHESLPEVGQPLLQEMMRSKMMRGWYFPIQHQVYYRGRVITDGMDSPQLRLTRTDCLTVTNTFNHGVSIRGFGGISDIPIVLSRTIEEVIADLEQVDRLQPSEYIKQSLVQARKVLSDELAREEAGPVAAAAV